MMASDDRKSIQQRLGPDLSCENEVKSLEQINNHISTIKHYLNITTEKINDDIQQLMYDLDKKKSEAVRLDDEQIHGERIYSLNNEHDSLWESLTQLEDNESSMREKSKSLENQIVLLENMKDLLTNLEEIKWKFVTGANKENGSVPEKKGQSNFADAEDFETALEHTTQLLSEIKLHKDLRPQQNQLIKVEQRLSSKKTLEQDLAVLKRVHKANFSVKLFKQISGIENIEIDGDDIVTSFKGDDIRFDSNKYSDFFITSQLWGM